MATHRPILYTDSFYHIFNCTIAKEQTFHASIYLNKIINIVDYYRYKQVLRFSIFSKLPIPLQKKYLNNIYATDPLVEIYSFSFMPNHFHFLLKQLQFDGIKQFISNIQNSYAKYFNLFNSRNGGLFYNSFKSKRIRNIEEFIHVSRYIHLNPVTSLIIDFNLLKTSSLTSFSWYLNSKINRFIATERIINHFKGIERYTKFIQDQIDYQKDLKRIKDLLLEK